MAVNIINNPTNVTGDSSQLTKGHGGKKGSKSFMIKDLLDPAEIAQGSICVAKKSQKAKDKMAISEAEESQVAQDENKMEKSKKAGEKHSDNDSDFINTYT